MKTEATITEHGKYLLNSHTTDVHYREFLRYFTKVSEYWLKLKEVKVDDLVSIAEAEKFSNDCDKLIHKISDIKEMVQFAIVHQRMEKVDKLKWLDDLKKSVMEKNDG